MNLSMSIKGSSALFLLLRSKHRKKKKGIKIDRDYRTVNGSIWIR